MSYQSAESAWRASIDYSDQDVTMVEWLCSCHQSDTAGPIMRYEVWTHGIDGPVECYRVGMERDDRTVPAWIPRPPDGWDTFPITQAKAAAR